MSLGLIILGRGKAAVKPNLAGDPYCRKIIGDDQKGLHQPFAVCGKIKIAYTIAPKSQRLLLGESQEAKAAETPCLHIPT